MAIKKEQVPNPDGNKSGSSSSPGTNAEEKTRGKKGKQDKPKTEVSKTKATVKRKAKKVSSWEEFIAGRKYAVKTKNDQGNVVDVASEIYAERKRKRKKEETDDSQGSETDPEEVCKKQLVHNLVNFRMKQGKKTRVRAIFNETRQRLAKTDRDGVQIISDALENVKPICEVARVRIAGNVYDFPGVVAKDRQQTLAVRWILDAAFKRRTNHSSRLEACLFAEIMDAYRKRGTARKKRENLHDLAANYRSYAHFRWW